MDIWYQSLKALLRTYRSLFQRSVHIQGRENLLSGPKIFIGNHANVTDSFVLPFLVREKLHFFVQEEAFSLWVIGQLFKLADQIPVVGGHGQQALDTARERLTRGHSVVIFPEGVLNHGRDFHRARTGAVVLASLSGVPLIPFGFYVPDRFMRTFHTQHYNRATTGRWQFGGPSYLQIGEPRRVAESLVLEKNYSQMREIAEQVMAYIASLVELAKSDANRAQLAKNSSLRTLKPRD